MAAHALVGALCLSWAQAAPPSLRVVDTRLEASFGSTDSPDAWLLLLRLPDSVDDCLSKEAQVARKEPIPPGKQAIDFGIDSLKPGNYCAMVSGPMANESSLHPVQVGWSTAMSTAAETGSCSNWNAIVVVTASYITSRVDAELDVKMWPGCSRVFRVGLWRDPLDNDQLACLIGIARVEEVEISLPAGNSAVVSFENMTAGNYCVRVTPICSGILDCLTLCSKVVELPEPVQSAEQRLPQGHLSTGLLALILVPLLLLGLLGCVLVELWRRRRRHRTTARLCNPPELGSVKKPLPPASHLPVVKVVYSRDFEAHNEAVWRLCSLLQSGLGLRVEYDEGTPGRAHLNAEWALAMADIACPRFPRDDEGETKGRAEKLLFIESEGGLIKQSAYRQDKDVGQCSETMWDDLYHTTYTALISRQAQALGDYCHIHVARFCYSPDSTRLNLVPATRYTLPEHTEELLRVLLHGWTQDNEDIETRVRGAMASDAHARFQEALSNARNTLDENPDLVRERLQAIAAP